MDPPRYTIPNAAQFDPKKLYGVKDSGPQYVDFTQKKGGRDSMAETFFYTGLLWGLGFAGGSVRGAFEGWRNAPSTSFRIRSNAVMNGMSKRGNLYATQLGSAMFVYMMSRHFVDFANDLGSGFLRSRGIINSELDSQYGKPFVTGGLAGYSLYKNLDYVDFVH